MDEAAFPILLVDLLRRETPAALGDLKRWWPMVRRAASFVAINGPVTQQDRWEEDAGYSPFTLAAEISALLAGADIADLGAHLAAPVEEVAPGEYRVAAPPTPSTVAALTAWLAEHDLPLADLRAGRQTLEDVFLRLTSGGRT